MNKKHILILMLAFFFLTPIMAQEANYDETKVPAFKLPDPLLCADGKHVDNIKEWERKRRPELLQLFADQEYGRMPKNKIKTSYRMVSENPQALGGLATSQQVMLTFQGQGQERKALLLAYIPNQREGRTEAHDACDIRQE